MKRKPTVREVIDWYREEQRPTEGRFSAVGEKERLRVWKVFCEFRVSPDQAAFGEQRCAEMRPLDMVRFLHQVGEGWSAWTRKRWATTICRPFNVAWRLGHIARNPFAGIRLPLGREGRDWTEREYATLLRASSPCFRRFLLFLRFSGARPGEARAMRWADLNIDACAIVLHEHKTVRLSGKPRYLFLNEVLVKLLIWLKRHQPAGTVHILLNSFGRPWSKQAVIAFLGRLRKRTGLPSEVKLHGGRHTFATQAVVNNLDIASLGQLLGHASLGSTERYVHLANKKAHLLGAMRRAIGGQAS